MAEAKKVRTGLAGDPGIVRFDSAGRVTSRQMSYWDSDYDLWSHTLAVNAETPFAHDAMGSALLEPETDSSPIDRGNLDKGQKQLEEARRHFERALELRCHGASKIPLLTCRTWRRR